MSLEAWILFLFVMVQKKLYCTELTIQYYTQDHFYEFIT